MIKDRYAGENKVDETLELAEEIEMGIHSIGLTGAVKVLAEEMAIDRCADLLEEPEDSSVGDAILQASMEVNEKLGLDVNIVFNIQGSYDIIVHGPSDQARKFSKEIKGIVSSYLEGYTLNDFTTDSDPPFGSKRADHSGKCTSPHSYCKTCDMEVCDAAEADFHRHQGCDVTELPTGMNVNSNPDRSSPVYQDRTPEADAYIHQSSRRINLASLKYGKAIARRMKKGDLPHYAYDVLEPLWKLETDEQGNQALVRN